MYRRPPVERVFRERTFDHVVQNRINRHVFATAGQAAVEAGITPAIHLAHPPGASRAEDLIGAKMSAGRQRH